MIDLPTLFPLKSLIRPMVVIKPLNGDMRAPVPNAQMEHNPNKDICNDRYNRTPVNDSH